MSVVNDDSVKTEVQPPSQAESVVTPDEALDVFEARAADPRAPAIAERSAAVLKKQPWGPWQRSTTSRAKTAAI